MIGIVFVLRLKTFSLKFFTSKCPHHTDTRQVFLGNGGQVSLLTVYFLEFLPDQSVEDQRADDHDRDKDCRDCRQPGLDGDHKIERHEDKNENMQQGSQLFGDKNPDGLDIRCAALNDITGAVFSQPGIRQRQDVLKQLVPGPLQKSLRAFFIAHLESIPAECTGQSGSSHRRRGKPQIAAQKVSAAQTRDDPGRPCRNSGQISSDHRIDRVLDQAGNDQVKKRHEACKDRPCREVKNTSPQEKEDQTYICREAECILLPFFFFGACGLSHTDPLELCFSRPLEGVTVPT